MQRRKQNKFTRRPLFKSLSGATIVASAVLFSFRAGCTSLDQSFILYRLPYANGTQVKVTNDHTTHSPANRLDLKGVNGAGPYAVVAAATGIVRIIEDDNTENCCGGSCANNYVWIETIGGEWYKESHVAYNSVHGDAGLSVGDYVLAGEFIGWESDVGRACGKHLHFEVAVPDDPNNPLTPSNGGFIQGINRIPRFCSVPGQIVAKDEVHTAASCSLILDCIRSTESPLTEGNCGDGLSGDVCVQEVDFPYNDSTYTKGVDFQSGSVKINLDWCPNAACDDNVDTGRAILVTVLFDENILPNADPVEFVANCQNRKLVETVHNVGEIIVQEAPNLSDENTACGGNEELHAFARWEICEIPELLAP